MAYPPSDQVNNYTDATLMATLHAAAHNANSLAIDDIVAELGINPSGLAADLTARLALGVGYVYHGATASTTRPAGFDSYIWIGTVEPTNMDATYDTWINPSEFPSVGPKFLYTLNPKVATGAANVNTANRGYYMLAEGVQGTYDDILVPVASGGATGNISVAVYNGSGTGINRVPTTRKATSGAVATPATMTSAGMQSVAISPAVSIVPGEDFLFLSCDSITPTFTRQSHSNGDSQKGLAYHEVAAHPAPASAGTLVNSFATFVLACQA